MSKPSMSPTRPKSIGVSPAPVTMRGGRRWARMTPLAPDTPKAGTPSPRSAATRSMLSFPATIIFMISSIGSSVTRRPPTTRDSTPSLRASAVACGPPPCTTSRRRPARDARDLGGRVRQRLPLEHVAPQFDDRVDGTRHSIGEGYGHGPGSSSDAVSATPSIRFMFWIAWPAPPLIRLSVALTIASVLFPVDAAGAPSVKPTSA